MTRDELHTEVATLTGEIVGMVSDLSPFDHKRKAEIDREILDLFDRYEAEKWSKPGDVPSGAGCYLVTYKGKPEVVEADHYDGSEWSTHEYITVARFRELPASPMDAGVIR